MREWGGTSKQLRDRTTTGLISVTAQLPIYSPPPSHPLSLPGSLLRPGELRAENERTNDSCHCLYNPTLLFFPTVFSLPFSFILLYSLL